MTGGYPAEWVETAAKALRRADIDRHAGLTTVVRWGDCVPDAEAVLAALAPLIAADRDAAVKAALDRTATLLDADATRAWQESDEDLWDEGYAAGMADATRLVGTLRDEVAR